MNAGGFIIVTLGGALVAVLVIGSLVMSATLDLMREEKLFGDLPLFPKELRPAQKWEAGVATEQDGRAGTGQVAHHDSGVL